MTYLRHASRHLQRTVQGHVTAWMDTLDWTTPGSTPFGTDVVVYQLARIEESLGQSIKGNLLAISFNGEPGEVSEEIGGGLVSIEYPTFIDCVGVEEPIAHAMAADVKDLLEGRADNTSRFVNLRDYTSDSDGEELTDYQIEFIDVVRERPGGQEWRRNWHVVKATARLVFMGSE